MGCRGSVVGSGVESGVIMINTDCVVAKNLVRNQMMNHVQYQVQTQVYEKVDYQVWDKVRWKVYAQVRDKVFR